MTALARPAPRSWARPSPKVERPKLRVLDSADERRRRRTVMLITAAGGAVLATLLGVLYLQVVMLQRQRQLDDLGRERTEVLREYQDLRRNVAQLESPDAVVKRATDELGMVPAPEVLYLEPAKATQHGEPLERTLGDGTPTPTPTTVDTATDNSPAAAGGTGGPAGSGAADGEPDSGDAGDAEATSTNTPSTRTGETPQDSTAAPDAPSPDVGTGTSAVDPATGLPVDPATGKTRYDPVTGQAIDPATGQPVDLGSVAAPGAGT